MTDQQAAALIAVLGRIAEALERQLEPDEDKLTYPLAAYASFDWTTIGAEAVQRDSDGVSVIRLASGRVAKRRSNDKFGSEIWFSYSSGRAEDGTPRYVKAVEFRDVAPPEPLGRKTEQAMKQAAAIPTAAKQASAELNADLDWLRATRVTVENKADVMARWQVMADTYEYKPDRTAAPQARMDGLRAHLEARRAAPQS